MKKYLPLIVVVIFLGVAGYFVLNNNNTDSSKVVENKPKESIVLKDFAPVRGCSKLPSFLYKAGIKRPIIDLSQEHYKGVAFLYGKDFTKVLHKKQWEQFEHLGTYTIDKSGNLYLTPNPFISIKPTTFNLQKAIYKLDSKSAKLTRYMVIDEVEATANNPYGLISLVYDCKDGSLWVSSIDKSNYQKSKGTIYHIDIEKKEILSKYSGFDALTVNWLYTKDKRYIIAGSARDNGVYIFALKDGKLMHPIKLFNLPDASLRVRKIKVVGKNTLKLEAIKFNYSLVAQTTKKQREIYTASYNLSTNRWIIKKR